MQTLYRYKYRPVNQKFQFAIIWCVSKCAWQRFCNTRKQAHAYIHTDTHMEGRSNVSHISSRPASIRISHAARHVRSADIPLLRSSGERERERGWPEGLLEFPAGICLIGNRHGRRSSPLHPTAPSARSHPRGNASRATCTSVFRPLTLILPSRIHQGNRVAIINRPWWTASASDSCALPIFFRKRKPFGKGNTEKKRIETRKFSAKISSDLCPRNNSPVSSISYTQTLCAIFLHLLYSFLSLSHTHTHIYMHICIKFLSRKAGKNFEQAAKLTAESRKSVAEIPRANFHGAVTTQITPLC